MKKVSKAMAAKKSMKKVVLVKAQKGISQPPIKSIEYKPGNKTSFVQKDKTGTAITTATTSKPVNKNEVNKAGKIDLKNNTVNSSRSYKAGSYSNIPEYKAKTYSNNNYVGSFTKSVDTTGYAAGKPNFTINIKSKLAGKPSKTTSKTINRSQVKSLLNNMESSARKGKNGGIVKSKKK